jgi:hypothetical protein
VPDSEIDRLDPEQVIVKLSTGYEVALQRLKTRQFFRLLKVLTRGVGPAVVQTGLDFKEDPEGFGQKLLAMTLMAIPEAEQQFIEFLQSMCKPVGLHEPDGRRLTKAETEDNQAAIVELVEELNNPELEDLLDLAEAIVRAEAPEIQALGKRVASMLELAKKTGQLGDKKAEETPETGSSEPSAPLSTSSGTSTDGPTSTSSPSPSAGSGSASRRRRPAASVSS